MASVIQELTDAELYWRSPHEDFNSYCLAVFCADRYSEERESSDFISYLTHPSHCTFPKNAPTAPAISEAYAQEVQFRTVRVSSFVIEFYDMYRISERCTFVDDFWQSLKLLTDSNCIQGAVVELKKHSKLSHWVASIADPQNVDLPESGTLPNNGIKLLHAQRCESLIPFVPGTPTRYGNYLMFE